MDPIKINCQVGAQRCDIEARELNVPVIKDPCFELIKDNAMIGRICKTVDGIYTIIGHTELSRDDIDAIGEQIDAELSSF
jgi:hypothetical protein